MDNSNVTNSYDKATLGIEAVALFALIVAFGIGLLFIRHERDSIRRPFVWLKVAMAFYIVLLALTIATAAISVHQFSDPDEPATNLSSEDQIANNISTAAYLIENLSAFLLTICLVDLGLSFIYLAQQQYRTPYKILYYATCAVAAILSILSLAETGALGAYTNQDALDNPDSTSASNATADLSVAIDTMLWIVSLPLFGWTIIALMKCSEKHELRTAHILHVICGFLFVLRNSWIFSTDVKWVLGYGGYSEFPLYTLILNALLDQVVMVVIFNLLCIIGFKWTNGVWSVPRQMPTSFSVKEPQYQQVQTAELGQASRHPHELWSTDAQRNHQELSAGEAHVFEVQDTSKSLHSQ